MIGTYRQSVVLNCAEKLHLFSPTQMRCVIDFLTFASGEEGRFNSSWAAYAIDHLKLNAPEAVK